MAGQGHSGRHWVVERWHLVLKDELKVERLQFDTFRHLSNAIALLSVVAWQLLRLKHLAAQSPETEAVQVLEPLQVEVSGKLERRRSRVSRRSWP